MSDPIAYVVSVHRPRWNPHSIVSVRCPYCGKLHEHGAGTDPRSLDLGLRVSHCNGASYTLALDVAKREGLQFMSLAELRAKHG